MNFVKMKIYTLCKSVFLCFTFELFENSAAQVYSFVSASAYSKLHTLLHTNVVSLTYEFMNVIFSEDFLKKQIHTLCNKMTSLLYVFIHKCVIRFHFYVKNGPHIWKEHFHVLTFWQMKISIIPMSVNGKYLVLSVAVVAAIHLPLWFMGLYLCKIQRTMKTWN